MRWQNIAAAVAARLDRAGLDLVHPFSTAWVNDALSPALGLPDFGRAGALGLLIGNTRALWPRLRATYGADPELRAAAHPLEHYTSTAVVAALAELPRRWRVRWSHDTAPRRPPMQRLAHLAGFAHLAPCGLNVHPTFGPWVAFRAVVSVDIAGPPGAPIEPAPCPDCAHACLPAFERARAALRDTPLSAATVRESWRLWLAVRDACPLGKAHRYGEDQIAYHYCGDRRALG